MCFMVLSFPARRTALHLTAMAIMLAWKGQTCTHSDEDKVTVTSMSLFLLFIYCFPLHACVSGRAAR